MNKKVNQSLKRVLKNIDFENDISKIDTDKNEYYELIEKYGITKKMNDIIDNFYKDTNTYSSLYNKIDLKIGIICDEFMYYSLKDTADFIYIPFTENMEVNKDIDVLLVVSSWRGLDHSWDYVANPKGRVREGLINLINLYKSENIKTVFYSKEDPVSYKQYLSTAKECDLILTSAKEMISEYIKDTGNINVDFLEFGINPMYHNPIGKNLADKKLSHIITFAGSWMVRFPRRNKEALEIFKGVNKSGYSLSIVDRQFERRMERYHFPSYLIKNISETIPHERLMKLHKATKWGINLNSVQDSYTMFANRVYELQAMGNVVISNYNKGVHEKFPNVILSNDSKDIEITLKEMSLKEQKRLIAEGISEVMLNHTAFHRVGKLAKMLNVDYKISEPKILVVGDTEKCRESYNHQSYLNSDYIKLNNLEKDNAIINSYDYIVFLSSDIVYGRRYIENLLSAFAYTNADVVTMNKDEYCYAGYDNYTKTSAMLSTKAFIKLNKNENDLVFFNIPRTDLESPPDLEINRQDKNQTATILIPIDNENYKVVENKSIMNLSNIDVDIKLVIYKSVEQELLKELKYLESKYHNVSYLDFSETNNIHTALNQTLETVTSQYATILYPGNKLSKNAFKNALKYCEKNEYDLIISQQNDLINNTNDTIVSETNIKTDAVVYSMKFLRDNNITFNEEVNISNNLFILESLKFTDKIKKVSQPFSFKLNTNKFYDKHKLELLKEYEKIEKYKLAVLNELDRVTEYSNDIFPYLFFNEYIPLFKTADKQEKVECLLVLENIYNLYKEHYEKSHTKLNEFIDLLLN